MTKESKEDIEKLKAILGRSSEILLEDKFEFFKKELKMINEQNINYIAHANSQIRMLLQKERNRIIEEGKFSEEDIEESFNKLMFDISKVIVNLGKNL